MTTEEAWETITAYVMARMENEQRVFTQGEHDVHKAWGVQEGYACPSAHVCVGWVEAALNDAKELVT